MVHAHSRDWLWALWGADYEYYNVGSAFQMQAESASSGTLGWLSDQSHFSGCWMWSTGLAFWQPHCPNSVLVKVNTEKTIVKAPGPACDLSEQVYTNKHKEWYSWWSSKPSDHKHWSQLNEHTTTLNLCVILVITIIAKEREKVHFKFLILLKNAPQNLNTKCI